MLTWVELDASALASNLAEFGRRVGSGPSSSAPEAPVGARPALGAVVKSNAYGHGMHEVARVALGAGASWLCVNSLEEALSLRAAWPDTPILVMGYVALDGLADAVAQDVRLVVYNPETVDRLGAIAARSGRTARVHLKLETGTNRQGVAEAALPAFVERVQRAGSVQLEGVYTHFANIEDTTDHGFAETQIATFDRMERTVAQLLGRPAVRHAACSAAALLFTRTHLDLVRLGISMYGLWPSKETYVSCLERGKPTLDLRPALTWKTRIAQVKDVAEGEYVGYGCAYRATRTSRIAVLPVGYYEGYDRGLSGVAHVLVRGRRAPIRGRVCMNMCMADVTDVPGVQLEDEVVLLGSQGEERIAAEQLASWCGTIAYEIVARIHPSLPRVVLP